jgi:L-iduronidase
MPNRGIEQTRVHYLLDLLIVTGIDGGFQPHYDFELMDYAIDFLVQHQLSPGFELMGSPPGFPILPLSFWQEYDGNGKIPSNRTLTMFSTLVFDLVSHFVDRYGPEEVAKWRFESWNEPDQGWGWPKRPANITYVTAWLWYYDACAAGIQAVEQKYNVQLKFGGPGLGATIDRSLYTQVLANHVVNEFNVWTGNKVKLDFISMHPKGDNTSYMIVEQEFDIFNWFAANFPTLLSVPFGDDEADPLVGWALPVDFRGDWRYGSIIPKVLNQHFIAVIDNSTGPTMQVEVLSNDNGFMNYDGFVGFNERTLTARFYTNDTNSFAFVRKSGLVVQGLLSRLGNQRCTRVTGINENVLSDQVGFVPSYRSLDSDNSSALKSVSALIYNNNDILNSTGPNDVATVSISISNTIFAPNDSLFYTVFQFNNDVWNPNLVWVNGGSPAIPTAAQIMGLWNETYGFPVLVPLTPISLGASNSVSIPAFFVPLPGVALVHVVAKPAAVLVKTPQNVIAYLKAPSVSLLTSAGLSEVLVRWDCDGNRNDSTQASTPSYSTATYQVQFSTSGSSGPWQNAYAGSKVDFSCTFNHALSTSLVSSNLVYRVAAVDFWNQASTYSVPVGTSAWPVRSNN